jgi:hypothetical protein
MKYGDISYRRASSCVSALTVEWRPIKQFELSCQRRDTQISLGAREVKFKCI